jgi:hypothetical protein
MIDWEGTQHSVNNYESLYQQSYQSTGNLFDVQPPIAHACNCMGPQNGDPVCPCMMKGVTIVDGRYIKTQDLGPVPDWKLSK